MPASQAPRQRFPAPVLAALQEALSAEHGAIVRLLRQAYQLGPWGLGPALESLARHEMRQFKWLAEQVVRGGGQPDLVARPEAPEEGPDPRQWLRFDLSEGEAAQARYHHLADLAGSVVPEEEGVALRALALRLAQDERDQGLKLAKILAACEAKAGEALPGPEGPPHDGPTAQLLDLAIAHEYEVILQYLSHAYVAGDAEVTRALEEVAVEEMRHLGWLTEARAARSGGCPFWQAKRLEGGQGVLAMLEADAARELEVVGDYAAAAAATEDPEARALFTTLHGHEAYHGQVLGRLIADLRAQASEAPPHLDPGLRSPDPEAPLAPPRPSPTVGSLLGQPPR